MKLYVQKSGQHKEMKFSGTAKTLLNRLKINPETIIITKNGILITEDDNLADSDDVEILQVVSGG